MTPVISPWVFYLMDVSTGLTTVAFLVGLVAIVWAANSWIERGKPNKKSVVIAITCAILFIFTPAGSTITKMIIAQNVTYERVEVTTNTVQSVYEDIMGLFEEEEDDG